MSRQKNPRTHENFSVTNTESYRNKSAGGELVYPAQWSPRREMRLWRRGVGEKSFMVGHEYFLKTRAYDGSEQCYKCFQLRREGKGDDEIINIWLRMGTIEDITKGVHSLSHVIRLSDKIELYILKRF